IVMHKFIATGVIYKSHIIPLTCLYARKESYTTNHYHNRKPRIKNAAPLAPLLAVLRHLPMASPTIELNYLFYC
ncbi:MAG TPA: hypothetical protein PL085_18285, partial [Agriterribacter sp.]|uniref:hypothetical protein n=1 Tax=Agriterribacter sp. TaxID=2821509 RepID=UPI002B5C95B0